MNNAQFSLHLKILRLVFTSLLHKILSNGKVMLECDKTKERFKGCKYFLWYYYISQRYQTKVTCGGVYLNTIECIHTTSTMCITRAKTHKVTRKTHFIHSFYMVKKPTEDRRGGCYGFKNANTDVGSTTFHLRC